jgi:hypothetical protein
MRRRPGGANDGSGRSVMRTRDLRTMLWGTVAQQLERLRGFALRQAVGDSPRRPPADGAGDAPVPTALPAADVVAPRSPRPPGEPPAQWLADTARPAGPPAQWLADIAALRAQAEVSESLAWWDASAPTPATETPAGAPVEGDGEPGHPPSAPAGAGSAPPRPVVPPDSAGVANRAAPVPPPPPGPSLAAPPPAFSPPPVPAPPRPAPVPPARVPAAGVRSAAQEGSATGPGRGGPPSRPAGDEHPVPPAAPAPPPPVSPLPGEGGWAGEQMAPPTWRPAALPPEHPAPSAPIAEEPPRRPARSPGAWPRRPIPLRIEPTPASTPGTWPAAPTGPPGGHAIAARSALGEATQRAEGQRAGWPPPATPARPPRSGLLTEAPAPPPDLRWADRAVAQRAAPWGVDTPGPRAAWDHAAADDPWPALPAEEPPPAEDPLLVLRAWERRRRLDQEQRGSGWSV